MFLVSLGIYFRVYVFHPVQVVIVFGSRKRCRFVFWHMQITMHKGEKQLQNIRQNIKGETL